MQPKCISIFLRLLTSNWGNIFYQLIFALKNINFTRNFVAALLAAARSKTECRNKLWSSNSWIWRRLLWFKKQKHL